MMSARVLEKMPTVMEMTEAVTEISFWLSVLLLDSSTDMQPDELLLTDMVAEISGGEDEGNAR